MASPAPPSSRDKILEVAEELFARRGYAGVGLREVAEQAGLGKSSLFHHFPTKDHLYCEVLDAVLRRIQERLRPVLRARGPAPERLFRWVETLIDALAEHPASARLLIRELVEESTLAVEDLPEAAAGEQTLAELIEDIRRLLAEGVESGAFRPVSIAETIQTLIGATVYHFASGEFGQTLLGSPLLSAEAIARRKREVVELLRAGLVA